MTRNATYRMIGATEARALKRALDGLLGAKSLVDALEELRDRAGEPSACAFERYAWKLLRGAGAERILGSARSGSLFVIAPEDGQLAKISAAGGPYPTMRPTLLSVECALNRLVCIADAIADGRREDEPAERELRRSISLLGGGYLAPDTGWRASRIVLPKPDEHGAATTVYYNEVDWRSTECVASNARAVFQRCLRPNAYATRLGVHVPNQSDWDVRTRIAQILRALELPHRYSFRFDYDGEAQTVSAVFTCPPTSFLPEISPNASMGHSAPSLAKAYECYLIRLACLFAAGCFGGGRGIRTVTVTGYNATWKHALVCAQFDRERYVRSVLVAVDSNAISAPELRFDPRALARLLDAQHLDWRGRSGEHGTGAIALPQVEALPLQPDPWTDERPLDDGARALFRCARVCDADASHYFGHSGDAIDLARDDADESPLAAIMRLEALVEDMEGELAPPGDEAQARPLYAAHALSRLAICLLEDELAVADQAEAFLRDAVQPETNNAPASARPTSATERGDARPPRATAHSRRKAQAAYFRAPDALYHARFGLSDLYQRLGDFSGAAAQADRCIALAPTTASAYYRKADVLAEQGFYEQAANVLITGLHYAATSADAALLYYHAAMLLWNLGMRRHAAAMHAYNASLTGEYAAKSKQVVAVLRNDPDAPPAVHASPFSAMLELRDLSLPVAPHELRGEILQATVHLANSGSPRAAAPYARELERLYAKDEIVVAACRSICHGTAIDPGLQSR